MTFRGRVPDEPDGAEDEEGGSPMARLAEREWDTTLAPVSSRRFCGYKKETKPVNECLRGMSKRRRNRGGGNRYGKDGIWNVAH